MSAPLVSVIVPAYNAEAFIGQAISSVLGQTVSNLEIIIVDDNSPDMTGNVVLDYAAYDHRVRYLRLDNNLGPGGARNTALDAARGEWIAVLDADDWYEADRLEKLIHAAMLEDVPVAADNQRFVTTVDGDWEQSLMGMDTPPIWRLTADDLLRGERLKRNARNLGLLKPVMRRDFLLEHGIRYDREITLGEDFYFLLKCLRYSPCLACVTEPLYNYRVYVPMTHTKRQTMDGFLAMRLLHARYKDLFNAATSPSTVKLMEQRRREIEQYIRFKRFVVPLRNGEIREFMKQLVRDPGGGVMFLYRVATDPEGVAQYFRTIVHRCSQSLADKLRIQTELSR